MRLIKRVVSFVLAVCMMFTLNVIGNVAFAAETDNDPVTVYIVGDSTACDYAATADANYYYKRVGYGTVLGDYLDDSATVVNLALSGKSSKSFTSEANYTTLISSMTEGDYLLIGFGHNDEKVEDATRGTTPGGSKDDEGTFKNSLYVNYIVPALEAGATPILVTPIVRRTSTGTWSSSQLHQVNDGDYSQDMIDLAEELDLVCIDATTLTKNLYDELTPSNTVYLHAWTSPSSTDVDNTHLNNYGAKYVSYLITEAIKSSESTLAPYVLSSNVAPTTADLVVNPDYTEASTDDVTGDDLISLLWTTSTDAGWYGTVFGDIGGDGKLHATDEAGTAIADELAIDTATGDTYYNISENADGSVNIRAGALAEDGVTAVTSVGKIAATSDGMAMYYTPVDAGTNFEISGTITVNGVTANNQVAFGAIVSDTIRVDTYAAGETYPYVAASPLRLARIGGEATAANATYARIEGTLTYGPEVISETITPGTVVNVSIKKVGDTFTVTYGDTVQEYTLAMEGTVYAGFFAARCADITVSNIKSDIAIAYDYNFGNPSNYDENAADIWDFGPTYVSGANNYITESGINDIFSEYSAGSTGIYFNTSFKAGDLYFSSDVGSRLRTSSTDVVKYDSENGVDNITAFDCMDLDLTGCMYFDEYTGNKKYFGMYLNTGDTVTIWAKYDSDGALHMYDAYGNAADSYDSVISGSANGVVQTFKADSTGMYYFNSGKTGGSVGIYRIMREKEETVVVSGSVTVPSNMPEYTLTFTNNTSGEAVSVNVTDGEYSVELVSGYTYTVTVDTDDNGYTVESGGSITVTSESNENDIVISGYELSVVTGSITGLTSEEIENLAISFVPETEREYTPSVVISGTTYSVNIEKNVNYTVEYSVSDDYKLSNSTICVTEDNAVFDLEFVEKSKYNVAVESDWCTVAELGDMVFTFTNVEDTDYVYSFEGIDGIVLRNGTYSVSVSNTGIFVCNSIDNITISDSDAALNIDFYSLWSFDSDFKSFTNGANAEFEGLVFNMTTAQYHSAGAKISDGTISVPTGGRSGILTVGVCYDYDVTLPDGENYNCKTGTTSVVDEYSCYIDGSTEYADITVGNDKNTYICYIRFEKANINNLFDNSPKNVDIEITNDGWNIAYVNDEIYAVSTNTDDSSTATISLTIEGPCVFYYEAAVSSEEYGDYLKISCNGKKYTPISGTDNYTFDNPYVNCIVLGEGENVITWEYAKDSSGADGDDCAWIKNLRAADLGDCNVDGSINITDAALGKKYISDESAITDLLGEYAADYNNDGAVDDADMAYILKEVIGNMA